MLRKITKIGTFILLATTWFSGVSAVTVGENVTLTRFLGFSVAGIWVYYKIQEHIIKKRNIQINKRNFNLIVIISLFIVLSLSSSLIAAYPSITINKIKTLLRLTIMAIIFLDVFDNEKDIKIAIKVLIYSGLFISINILLQYFTGYNILATTPRIVLTSGGIFRATGSFSDPNYAALKLSILIPLGFYYIKTNISKQEKLLILFGLLIFLFAILLTFSRAAIMILLFSIGMILIEERFNMRYSLILGIVIIAAIFLLPLDKILERFYTVRIFFRNLSRPLYLSQHYGSMWMRFNAIKAGLKTFLYHPIVGVGLGNFRFAITKYSIFIHREIVAHNTYIGILTELGIVGFSLFVTMIIMVINNFKFFIKRNVNKNIHYLISGVSISFLTILFGFLFLSALYISTFWVLVSFSMIFFKVSRSKKGTNHEKK